MMIAAIESVMLTRKRGTRLCRKLMMMLATSEVSTISTNPLFWRKRWLAAISRRRSRA